LLADQSQKDCAMNDVKDGGQSTDQPAEGPADLPPPNEGSPRPADSEPAEQDHAKDQAR